MIHYQAYLDAEGWLQATHLVEGSQPSVGAEERIPLARDGYLLAQRTLLVRHGPDGLEVPADDRTAWRAARRAGRPGTEAMDEVHVLREARSLGSARDLSILIPDPPPRMTEGLPAGAPYPDIPDLRIEALAVRHLEAMAAIAIDAGLLPATCPVGDCQPPEAHAWLELASRIDNDDQWQYVLTFQGQPIQYEIITFAPDRDRAMFSITYHATRERPSWFWRECERPIYEGLRLLGVTRLESRTRADRPDWIQSLKDNYGAVERGTIGPITRLNFPLDLTRFQGWPARKMLGFDQTGAGGRARIWEAAEADLPAIRALLEAQVPAGQRAIVLRMLEEWWHLDRATILVGSLDGALRYVRGVRPRRGTVAGLAYLGPLHDDVGQRAMSEQAQAWMRAAGYTKYSGFVPDRLLSNPQMQAQVAREGARLVGQRTQYREPFTEFEADL